MSRLTSDVILTIPRPHPPAGRPGECLCPLVVSKRVCLCAAQRKPAYQPGREPDTWATTEERTGISKRHRREKDRQTDISRVLAYTHKLHSQTNPKMIQWRESSAPIAAPQYTYKHTLTCTHTHKYIRHTHTPGYSSGFFPRCVEQGFDKFLLQLPTDHHLPLPLPRKQHSGIQVRQVEHGPKQEHCLCSRGLGGGGEGLFPSYTPQRAEGLILHCTGTCIVGW